MNPYLNIWFNTSRTITSIIAGERPFIYHIPLLFLGISAFIGMPNMDLGISGYILSGALAVCLIYLLMGQYLPWTLHRLGRIWNGQASFEQLQLIVSLAQIPAILVLLMQLAKLGTGEFVNVQEINGGVAFISWIFSMRILIIGISKVQHFNYGLAIVSLFLSFLPFFIIQYLRM